MTQHDRNIPEGILPADEDYWRSFRERVLRAAGPELARRRAAAPAPGIAEVLFEWRRRLVPASLAVTLAALVLTLMAAGGVEEGPVTPPTPSGVGLEDVLVGAGAMEGELDLRLQRLQGEGEMDVDAIFYAVESAQ